MKKNILLSVAAGVLIVGTMVSIEDAEAKKKKKKEKCYGVVKAEKNDCGNAQGTHSCAAQATVDGDSGEWVYVPKGLCERLVGGSLTPGDNASEDSEISTE